MTRIVADTTCGLAPDEARRLQIPMIPQIINFGDQSFREGIDIDFKGFMDRLMERRYLPKTAAPYPGDFIEAFRELSASGESIVCIMPSSVVSGTVRSATVARESFPGVDIRILDTGTIAGPLAAIVIEADKLARSGASADEVEALVHRMMGRARILFLVDTMEFLRRGGRIGGAAAAMGTLLQIKPILTFSNGRIEQFGKERTKRKALSVIKQVVQDTAARGDDAHLAVMHTGAVDEADALAQELCAITGSTNTMIMELVPAIVTHAGPGALAVGFFEPEAKES